MIRMLKGIGRGSIKSHYSYKIHLSSGVTINLTTTTVMKTAEVFGKTAIPGMISHVTVRDFQFASTPTGKTLIMLKTGKMAYLNCLIQMQVAKLISSNF